VRFVIPKGDADKVRQRGLFAFRRDIVELAPFVQDRAEELNDWDQIKLLAVAIDRLRQWYRPGLLSSAIPPTDVAGRRRRHQSRNPGRGGGGKYPGGTLREQPRA